MNPGEAEAIVALEEEFRAARELCADKGTFLNDWRLQFAAERVIERIFQAANGLEESLRKSYFGEDELRFLRGMRNRLAHNYLDVDHEIVWNTLNSDIPAVQDRMKHDLETAQSVLAKNRLDNEESLDFWREEHLGNVGGEPS